MNCLRQALFLLAAPMTLGVSAPAAKPPNILLIVADDMGYSDAGCFGGEIPTPALDRLAREGVRLTHCFNGGMCVVSRASLLTGRWWPRALPGFARTPLLSERLRAVGYRTALVGKWHLPGNPLDRGFDHFFGFLGGFADHFAGAKDYRLDREPFTRFGPDFYSSDAFAEQAAAFIQSSAAKPFFLFLSFQAPHNPLQAPRDDILRHRGRYLSGWQAVREARFRRQKEMGLVSASVVLPAYPRNLPDWESLTPAQRDLEDLRRAVYTAMIERMDRAIGRVTAALRASGQDGNTLILFLSDNGSDSFSVVDETLLKQGKLPGDPHSNFQPGTGWAYANDTPWRLYKISQHGGGVTTGAIAWWPGHMGKAGRIERAAVHLIDVFPTMLAAATASSNTDGIAGESFWPLLRGEAWRRQGPLFFQFADNRAIRKADWTLAEVDGAGWELFQSRDDPLENVNLAGRHRTVVAELEARWLQWWRTESGKADYLPQSSKGSPHYKPQGDRGSGVPYVPSAMPEALAARYPVPPKPSKSEK